MWSAWGQVLSALIFIGYQLMNAKPGDTITAPPIRVQEGARVYIVTVSATEEA